MCAQCDGCFPPEERRKKAAQEKEAQEKEAQKKKVKKVKAVAVSFVLIVSFALYKYTSSLPDPVLIAKAQLAKANATMLHSYERVATLQVELEGFEDFGVMSPSSAAIEDHALMQELKELDRDIDDLHL